MLKVNADAEKKKIAGQIIAKLAEHYPEAKTSLVFDNPFQLFVATVLSAQTTDEQVNKITVELFKAVPTVRVMSGMTAAELEPYLKSCGLYRNKSRFLIEASRIIVDRYNGMIPDDFNELVKLPGVGRKTANVIIAALLTSLPWQLIRMYSGFLKGLAWLMVRQ
jgi:endonuclease III